MATLKISHILAVIIVVAFFLMPIGMSIGVIAKEQTNLRESKYVEIIEPPSIRYEDVSGKVKNGSEVSVTLILTFSPEIEESTLFFWSDLQNASGHINIDGSQGLENDGSFTVDHQAVETKEVRIGWSGTAPEVKRRENITLLNITQEIKEKYLVVDIKKDVTSEIIEAALDAWHKADEAVENANWTIANATKAGTNVEAAQTSLNLAKVHLNTSRERYNAGRPEEALEEANKALESAKVAEEKAEGAITSTKSMNYAILAVVVIISIVVFIFLIGQRRKKRGIY